MSINRFRENKQIPDYGELETFCMDGSEENSQIPDMRQDVELGTCNCCDYFFMKEDRVFLVEQTRLGDTVKSIESDYLGLDTEKMRNYVRRCILQENYVKVYGALLVLCRLVARCEEAKQRIDDKKSNFWLVIEGTNPDEPNLFLDELRDYLFSDLRSKLSKGVIDKVEIIPDYQLADRLRANAPTS